jgi:hypothetical protein
MKFFTAGPLRQPQTQTGMIVNVEFFDDQLRITRPQISQVGSTRLQLSQPV